MKQIAILLIGILIVSCSRETETTYSTDSEKVFLFITKSTTNDELIKISAEFKLKKNIDIDFSESEFYNNGKIKNLNLKVDCNDGFKGIMKNHGKTFNLNKSGFLRDYSENSNIPFQIGSM